MNQCPNCASSVLHRDGLRYLKDGDPLQRWLCRKCGLRFSGPGQAIFVDNKPYRVRGRKNPQEIELAQSLLLGKAAGDEALLAQFEWKSLKRGIQKNTIETRKCHLKALLRDGADLNNPDSVETTLAVKNYSVPKRWCLVHTYRVYCKLFNIQWEPIRVKYQPPIPYMPTEEQAKIFIAALPKTLNVFCAALFETGARKGELSQVEWTDINPESCSVSINHPEKGSNPRTVKVSKECIDLLMSLPKKHGVYVFNPKSDSLDGCFVRQRQRVATKLQKPEFLKIHFHTFRHMRGTLDVHNHVPLFEVKEKLGHKYIANTEKYVHWNRQLYYEKSDRYHFAATSKIEQAQALIETGYEFVTDMNGMKLFRKPR